LEKINTKEKYLNYIYSSFLYFKQQIKLENKASTIGEQLLAYYWIKVNNFLILIKNKNYRLCKIKEIRIRNITSIYLKISNNYSNILKFLNFILKLLNYYSKLYIKI